MNVKDKLFFSISGNCYYLVGDYSCYKCNKRLSRVCTVFAHWSKLFGEVIRTFCYKDAKAVEQNNGYLNIYTRVMVVPEIGDVPGDALFTPISMFRTVPSKTHDNAFSAAVAKDGSVVIDKTKYSLRSYHSQGLPEKPVKLIRDDFKDDDPEGLLRAIQKAKPVESPKYYLEDNTDRGGEV